jgi:hypothetical protein
VLLSDGRERLVERRDRNSDLGGLAVLRRQQLDERPQGDGHVRKELPERHRHVHSERAALDVIRHSGAAGLGDTRKGGRAGDLPGEPEPAYHGWWNQLRPRPLMAVQHAAGPVDVREPRGLGGALVYVQGDPRLHH